MQHCRLRLRAIKNGKGPQSPSNFWTRQRCEISFRCASPDLLLPHTPERTGQDRTGQDRAGQEKSR